MCRYTLMLLVLFSLCAVSLRPDIPRILHTVWISPSQTETGSRGKLRTLNHSQFTGCCDMAITIALKSYVKYYKGYRIWIWHRNDWNVDEFIYKIGLSEHIEPHFFDISKELPMFPELPNVTSVIKSVVLWSDLIRYAVLYKYGGSYVDLDSIAVRPPILNMRTLSNLSPARIRGFKGIDCPEYVVGDTKCILSNGLFVNYPKKHVLFESAFRYIVKHKYACSRNFFCYSP